MPDHIKLILRHAALGGVIAAAFVGGVLALNVANLWHLVSQSADGPLALTVFFVLCWITFGSVQIGIAIMMMSGDDQGGGTRAPEPLSVPIPVRVDPAPDPRGQRR